jgi:hypothetical protein
MILLLGIALPAQAQQADSTLKNPVFTDTTRVSEPAITSDSTSADLAQPQTKTRLLASKKVNAVKPADIDSLRKLVHLDSSEKKKLLKKLIPKTRGTISAGYDYGIIPFAANISYPMGYYSSQGNVGFNLLGLPLNATYYYSSLKNIAGLNNYFRISFDAPRYNEYIHQVNYKKLDLEKQQLSNLLNLQQLMTQKLTYYELMAKDMPSQMILNSQLQNYKNKYSSMPSVPQFPDTLSKQLQDSLSKVNVQPKVKTPSYADSIQLVSESLHKYDSVMGVINTYRQEIQNIQKQVKAINNKIALLENPQHLMADNPYLQKMQSFMSGVKKMDIGLCYPNYSNFLVSGSTIKGFNLEWEKKFYFACTFGKTINTIMTTNNIIQNQLQTGRNLYNFFDFNNVKDSRKIAAVKFGVGKKESTHFYAGVLYGVGLPSYLGSSVQPNLEKNFVVELDGKLALGSGNSIDLAYGKSSIFQSGINQSPDELPGQGIFSKFRSNAGLLRYNSEIKRTKTKITATGRIIDPFFKSYGVGFLRSDNLRYELKIDQAIGSRIKFSGFYRRDQDNILGTFLYTTSLQTMGANLTVKVNKRLTARASYMPVVQNIQSKDSSAQNIRHINNISNAILTYMPRIQKGSSIFNAMYSYYQLNGSNNYQNFNLSNTTIFNAVLKSDIAFNYFYNNTGDTLNSNTTMVAAHLSISGIRGITITSGVKYANNSLLKNQVGGSVKINIPLMRYISFELMAERLVMGDFYNSYNLTEIRKFPYYGYGKVIVTW